MSEHAIAPWRQLQTFLSPPVISPKGFHCGLCQEALPLFITDEMVGQPVDTLYPLVARHLDECRTCLAEYEALSELMDLGMRIK